MKLFSQKMTESHAIEILKWQYPSPYDMYNQEVTTAGIEEYLGGLYRAITDQKGNLIGYYCTHQPAQVPKGHEFKVYEEPYLDIGLGMKPELTGQGFGREFLTFILKELEAKTLRLTVATFNQRAIRLYEGFEFEQADIFTNGEIEFTIMIKHKNRD